MVSSPSINLNPSWRTLEKGGNQDKKLILRLKGNFFNELRGQYFDNLREAGEFHRLPMQVEVRYLPPHKREGGTMENVVGERPNAFRTTALKRIFAQTNPITQPGVYEGGFSFNGGPGGTMQPPVGVNGNWGQQV